MRSVPVDKVGLRRLFGDCVSNMPQLACQECSSDFFVRSQYTANEVCYVFVEKQKLTASTKSATHRRNKGISSAGNLN